MLGSAPADVAGSRWARCAAGAVMAVTLMACYGGYDDDYYDDCANDPSICQDGGVDDELCFDGLDNDLDGAIDCDDPNCAEECLVGSECADARAITSGSAVELRFSDAGDDLAGSCVGAGRDDLLLAYAPGEKEVGVPGTLRVTWSANGPVGAHVRSECSDAASEVGCVSASATGVLPVPMTNGAEPVTIALEAVPSDASGAVATSVTVELEYVVAECGNGVREASEQCDDDNTVAGDGCSPYCFVEPNHYCAAATPLVVGSNAGDTAGGSQVFSGPSCTGPERLFAFTAPADGTLALTLTSAADLRLLTFTTCHAEAFVSQACSMPGTPTQLAVTASEPTYVVVAGATEADSGSFTVDAAFTPAP